MRVKKSLYILTILIAISGPLVLTQSDKAQANVSGFSSDSLDEI